MKAGAEIVAKISHARGVNAYLPPGWLPFIVVQDLHASLECCRELGGETIGPIRDIDSDRMCVIRDPAGAVIALYQYG